MKPLIWLASTLELLREFPGPVQQDIGYALELAQKGEKHPRAKPMTSFKGAGVLEIVADHDGDTWRAVYTVNIKEVIYVLHVFKKKSKTGIATPKREIDLIHDRLKAAIEHSREQSS